MEKFQKTSKEKRLLVQTNVPINLQGKVPIGENRGENVTNVQDNVNEQEESKTAIREMNEDAVEGLKNQLEALTNSLAVLSAEKSRMEATFQSEKRQIRSEREEHERVVKNLKEKLKRIQGHAMSEVEHLKYKLIMERHEREKDQSDHLAVTKQFQKTINDEQTAKEELQGQLKELKSNLTSKSQNRLLEAELDVLRNKLKQAESTANETPAMLLNLQTEMALMKKKHKNAILEEQKRAFQTQQEAKALAASYESRIAGLESRLAELSNVVGGYDRLRQQDQKAIHKLKEEIVHLQNNKKLVSPDSPQELSEKIKQSYLKLKELDKSNFFVNELLNSIRLCDKNQEIMYKEKYQNIIQEFEDYKRHRSNQNEISSKENHSGKDEALLLRAKSHNKNLEEKIRMLVAEISEKNSEFKAKIELQQNHIEAQHSKDMQLLSQKESEYLNKIANLEQQLLRQRERSLNVIQEKEKEIQTLKSTFDTILSKKMNNLPLSITSKQKSDVGDLMTGILSTDNNPPMLHYTQEIARKEVQISGLRKQNVHLETALRELKSNSFRETEKFEEEVRQLNEEIKRLDASKSRESANLEYLKNVFINYLTSKDMARKRHMLNAISTILRFTSDENDRIDRVKI